MTILSSLKATPYCRYFIYGLLLPLGFAPFHFPGLALLGLSLFYHQLSKTEKKPLICGLFFGLGFFTFGVSWVYNSVHDYGHLHGSVAALITFAFLFYLSLFPALTAAFFSRLKPAPYSLYSALLFSALWTVSEYARADFLSGFPWLLIGVSQFDTPLKFLLPIIGVSGTSLITCFLAALLSNAFAAQGLKRTIWLVSFVLIFLFPLVFQSTNWVKERSETLSASVVQANLSMRDKWDEMLFWQLLDNYELEIEKLLGTDLIVLPESALPLPPGYISDSLTKWHDDAKNAGSAILLGIPEAATLDERFYYNSLISLGKAKGIYHKKHLVPFGEYIPHPFSYLLNWLGIPEANLKPGKKEQTLVSVHHHPVASLICYELAYGELLRQQLPEAEWIVSISDNGWFGRSFAMYQQQQMAQVRSIESGRYQIVANNDGLSSIINTQGDIVTSLAAYSSGLLKGKLIPATGQTPWVFWGELPALLFSLLLIIIFMIYKGIVLKVSTQTLAADSKRRYPYPPS